jgi:hypothetical protein
MEERMEMDFISQPLTTEDGFLNPACMAELNTAIRNVPKTHDRLSGDPEWTAKRWTTVGDIVGGFAKYACRQSPYGCPDNLEAVVKYLRAALLRSAKWTTGGMEQLSLCEISRMLHWILYDQGVSYFDAWNRAKVGETPDVLMSTGLEHLDPDRDFIDLDALLHNVCLDIRLERRASDAFNKQFEEEWQKQQQS